MAKRARKATKRPRRPAPKPLWVCLYHHRHGVDFAVYTGRRDALRGACVTMLDNLHEEVEDRVRCDTIRENVLAGNYLEALSLYEEATGQDEYFEIEERGLMPSYTAKDLARIIAKQKAADDKALADAKDALA